MWNQAFCPFRHVNARPKVSGCQLPNLSSPNLFPAEAEPSRTLLKWYFERSTMCPFQCWMNNMTVFGHVWIIYETVLRHLLRNDCDSSAESRFHFLSWCCRNWSWSTCFKISMKLNKNEEVTDPEQTLLISDQPLFLRRARMIQSRIHRQSLGNTQKYSSCLLWG